MKKKIVLAILLLSILGITYVVYFQGIFNSRQQAKGSNIEKEEKTDWVNKYQEALNKGNFQNALVAGTNIIKEQVSDITFDQLLKIARDKTKTKESDIEYRCMTIEFIKQSKNKRVFSELKNIAEDKDENITIRAYAVQQMDGKNEEEFNYLISQLNNEHPEIRSIAAFRLGFSENVKAGPYLMTLLNDEDELVRNRTIRSLGRLKCKEAVDKLIQVLLVQGNSKDFKEGVIKGVAAEALGEISDGKAIEPLISVFLDKKQEDFVRDMVSKALINFKDSRVVDALIKVVEEHDYNSIAAAEALGEIGDIRAANAIKEAIEQEKDAFALSKYKEAYKKITGKDYVEQQK